MSAVGLWNGEFLTTDTWNKASKNNTANGYALEGPGLDKNYHLVAGSLCIDRGAAGLVSVDIDGKMRPSAVASIQDADTLLPFITKLVSERFGFYHTGIFLLDEAQEFAVLRAANSEG